jgi:PAS domain S-box-containing protein
MIATVREGVLLIDDAGRIEYANPSLLRMFGRTAEELAGSSVERLGIVRDDLEDTAGEAAGGLPVGARELHLHDGAGKPIVVLATSSRLGLQDRLLLVCVLQDVTELRRLERRILSDVSTERVQLSSEVHEGIAQDLTGIALLLKGVRGKNVSDGATLEFIADHVNNVLHRARALARGLSPVQVAGGSLTLALSRSAAEIARARSIDVVCTSDLSGLDLSATQADHLYRIALECLRFAAGRPDCSKITLDLRIKGAVLALTSTGNGSAPAAPSFDDGRGWGAIAYVARAVGGNARVDELVGEGTRITVLVPVARLATGTVAHLPEAASR